MGSYGEVLDWVGAIYDSTKQHPDLEDGDATIKKQLAKLADARSYFRYPNIEANGHTVMRLESAIGWRDDRYPGVITYLQRGTRDASMLDTAERLRDARSIAFVQQAMLSGDFETSVRDVASETSLRATIGLMNARRIPVAAFATQVPSAFANGCSERRFCLGGRRKWCRSDQKRKRVDLFLVVLACSLRHQSMGASSSDHTANSSHCNHPL